MLLPPTRISAPDELLHDAQELVEQELALAEQRDGVAKSCGPRCSACCSHAVLVTPAEARSIHEAVEQLPSDLQLIIRERAKEVGVRAQLANIIDDQGVPLVEAPLRRYFQLGESCPLLIDDECAVRSARPLVCRQYAVSSEPQHCSTKTLERVTPVLLRRRPSRGFAKVSAAFGEGTVKPLPLALLSPPPARPDGDLQQSGPEMALLLTEG